MNAERISQGPVLIALWLVLIMLSHRYAAGAEYRKTPVLAVTQATLAESRGADVVVDALVQLNSGCHNVGAIKADVDQRAQVVTLQHYARIEGEQCIQMILEGSAKVLVRDLHKSKEYLLRDASTNDVLARLVVGSTGAEIEY